MVFSKSFAALMFLLASQASLATTKGPADSSTSTAEPRSIACANARTPSDKAAFELAQVRAISAYLRQSRGMVSGQEGLVRDESSASVLRTAVAAARLSERSVKTAPDGQMLICVELVFGPPPRP